jgi:hypothetical protein
MHGYNEIQWSAVAKEDTRRFIVEYSVDGINYQSAGELTPLAGNYSLNIIHLIPGHFFTVSGWKKMVAF